MLGTAAAKLSPRTLLVLELVLVPPAAWAAVPPSTAPAVFVATELATEVATEVAMQVATEAPTDAATAAATSVRVVAASGPFRSWETAAVATLDALAKSAAKRLPTSTGLAGDGGGGEGG